MFVLNKTTANSATCARKMSEFESCTFSKHHRIHLVTGGRRRNQRLAEPTHPCKLVRIYALKIPNVRRGVSSNKHLPNTMLALVEGARAARAFAER